VNVNFDEFSVARHPERPMGARTLPNQMASHRITRRHKRVLLIAAATALTGFLIIGMLTVEDPPSRSTGETDLQPTTASTDLSAAANNSTTLQAALNDPGLRAYAVDLARIQGLPHNASPGTRLQIWVLWERPVVKAPRMQLLIERAILERIVPAFTPTGPDAALLLVKARDIPDLAYGDRFGSLSFSVIP
jgi:hypothetical protein